MTHIRWGIIGASDFARNHMAPAINAARDASLDALATSNPRKAVGFQAIAPHLRVHGSYDALLADPQIDAVYIPLPNHLHVEWTLKALDAGKAVLCEKPLTLKAADFDPAIAKRDATGLLAAEAFMIVHHTQFQRARDLVREGAIGRVVHVDSHFSYDNRGATDNIRNRSETGGGVLPDIGVYTAGAARFVTGQEPQVIRDANIRFENGVDVTATVSAMFETFSYTSTVSMRMHNRQDLTITGETGMIRLTCPYNANVHDVAELILETQGGVKTVERWPAENHYVTQVEAFGRAMRGEEDYACPLELSQGTQRMIDMIYEAARG